MDGSRRVSYGARMVILYTFILALLAGPERSPDDVVVEPTPSACGVVQEAAGCRTITIWTHPARPQICRCPWDIVAAPAPCAPGEGDCSE